MIKRNLYIFKRMLIERDTRLSTILAIILIIVGIYGGIKYETDWLEDEPDTFEYSCTDLRDGDKFTFRTDDAGQIKGKYQIKPGVYIDISEKIKCVQTFIKAK